MCSKRASENKRTALENYLITNMRCDLHQTYMQYLILCFKVIENYFAYSSATLEQCKYLH